MVFFVFVSRVRLSINLNPSRRHKLRDIYRIRVINSNRFSVSYITGHGQQQLFVIMDRTLVGIILGKNMPLPLLFALSKYFNL